MKVGIPVIKSFPFLKVGLSGRIFPTIQQEQKLILRDIQVPSPDLQNVQVGVKNIPQVLSEKTGHPWEVDGQPDEEVKKRKPHLSQPDIFNHCGCVLSDFV